MIENGPRKVGGLRTIDHYRDGLYAQQWRYAAARRLNGALDPTHTPATGAPFFRPTAASGNVILKIDDDARMRTRVLGQLATRRSYVRSMASPQALAHSVFGNLAVRGQLRCLAGLEDDVGRPLFFEEPAEADDLTIDHGCGNWLIESRAWLPQVWTTASSRIVVDPTLAEDGVGSCDRLRLDPDDVEYCNGSFADVADLRDSYAAVLDVGEGLTGCPLADYGETAYWQFLPRLLGWRAVPGEVCPLAFTLQPVQDILDACLLDGDMDLTRGHAVLIVDARNPSFAWSTWRPTGGGSQAIDSVRGALGAQDDLLRIGTWQMIARAIGQESGLGWLVQALREKYGIEPA